MKKSDYIKLLSIFLIVNIFLLLLLGIISALKEEYEFEFSINLNALLNIFLYSLIIVSIGLIIGLLIPLLLYNPKRREILIGSEIFVTSIFILLFFISQIDSEPEHPPLETSKSEMELSAPDVADNQSVLNKLLKEYESGYKQASIIEKLNITNSTERAFSFLVDSISRFGYEFHYDKVQFDPTTVTYFYRDDSVYYRKPNTGKASYKVLKPDTISTMVLSGNLTFILREPNQNSRASLILIEK